MENKIIQKGYDTIAELYHNRRLSKKEINYKYFDDLMKYFPKKGKVLDLGCGGGVPVLSYFTEKGFECTGVDISEKMIKIAENELPNANLFVEDMANLNFKNEMFDLIVSTYAIIHIPQEKQHKLLLDIYNWLKPNGKAYLVLGEKDKKSEIKNDWHGVEMYWSYYSPKKYNEIFIELGFKKIWEEIEDIPNGEQFYNVILEK